MNRPLRALALLLCLAAGSAGAAQFMTFDRWEIHHNAVRADFIPAEVARVHGITRSTSRGLVNIAVLQRAESGSATPSAAGITLTVYNLAGQSQAVRMRPVQEPDALYYIGEFRISGVDTWRFEAEVQPEGATRPYRVVWRQELFAE